jgi:hypothetical protein
MLCVWCMCFFIVGTTNIVEKNMQKFAKAFICFTRANAPLPLSFIKEQQFLSSIMQQSPHMIQKIF